jgi:enamine deaminase RidA (YjgF/YER057c/UK114 family)
MTTTGHNPPELWDAHPAGMSQAVSATGRIVVVSGQVALDADGNLVSPGDFEGQAVQAFENLGIALAAAGATFADVVRLGSYVTDISNLGILREVRLRYLSEPYPAATALEAGLAMPQLLVEVEAMAVVSSS